MIQAQANNVAEWGMKIIEVYMTWYTFFMTSNVLLLGWFASKDSSDYDSKPLIAVSSLFIVLNCLGSGSTWMVAHSVGQSAPVEYRTLILYAGYANIAGLMGNVTIWAYLIVLQLRRKE
jgi:hypothetical protein